jgi:hypothetical protein
MAAGGSSLTDRPLPLRVGDLFRSSREPEGLGFSGAEPGLARESAAPAPGLGGAAARPGRADLRRLPGSASPLVGDGQVLLVVGDGGGEPLSDAQGLTV